MRRRYDFDVDDNNSEFNLGESNGRNRSSIHGVPVYVGLLFLTLLVGLFAFVNYLDNLLPTALTVADEKKYPDAFITERAKHDLKILTDMGPRVVGDYTNEVLAVDFLQREINIIIHQKHKNQKIELDTQTVSGQYYLGVSEYGRINKYSNIQNIVVKLHSRNDSNSSVLVNSHFDSVPTSPGGSDDGISVVTMLEVLRKLSRSPNPPTHNIIFLFNGAEETPLQASHGFISQHKWAKECKVLINLEACGSGGKIILFQTGPERAWLMKYYAQVPHPYGQAAGEEIFQSGAIPSDTDFRIFRDFGGLVGYDMAFFKNGYRYHTKYDNFEFIPDGSYQHIGDNTLSLVKSLAEAPELDDPNIEKSKAVYFDVFGLFFVYYSTLTACIINILVTIASFAIFVVCIVDFKVGVTKTTARYLALVLGAILLGWGLAFAAALFIGFVLDSSSYSMSWYSSNWIIFGIYVVPAVACMSLPLFWVNHPHLSLNVTSQLQAHITRLIWTGVLLVTTILGIRASYAIMVPILFNTLSFAVIHIFRIQHSIRKWQIVYVTGLIIPTMLLMFQASITLALFIPITGRFGSNKNPETVVAVITVGFTVLIASSYVALVTLLRNAKYFFITLGALLIISLIVVFSALGLPYNGDVDVATPQRYWIAHTSRAFHDASGKLEHQDSGIFFLNMDRNSPHSVAKFVKDLDKGKSLDEDCKKYVMCGLPLWHLLMIKIMHYSTWIPAKPPMIHEPVQFKSIKQRINSTSLKYTISVVGPDRMGIYIVPRDNITMQNIEMDNAGENLEVEPNKKVYFIRHTYGKSSDVLKLSFYVDTPPDWDAPTVDLAVTAFYVHNRTSIKMPYYEDLIKQFPDWADVTAWLASYNGYIL